MANNLTRETVKLGPQKKFDRTNELDEQEVISGFSRMYLQTKYPAKQL